MTSYPRIRHFFVFILLTFSLTLIGYPAQADVAGVFSKGRKHFAIYGGTGYAFNDDYLVLGISGHYYLTNGFNIGLAVETWTGGDPGITKLTPELGYVFYQVPTVKPYVGVFYRRAYIDNLPDLESTGARAGVWFASGNNVYIGVGGVYEKYLSCNETTYRSCDETYPELSITFAF